MFASLFFSCSDHQEQAAQSMPSARTLPLSNVTPQKETPNTLPSVTNASGYEASSSSGEEAFCDICKKEFCSKYFLMTHKMNAHGVSLEEQTIAQASQQPALDPQRLMAQIQAMQQTVFMQQTLHTQRPPFTDCTESSPSATYANNERQHIHSTTAHVRTSTVAHIRWWKELLRYLQQGSL